MLVGSELEEWSVLLLIFMYIDIFLFLLTGELQQRHMAVRNVETEISGNCNYI